MRLRLLCLTTLLVAGCNNVTLVDDIDLVLDFTPLVGPSDALHQPYVQGAQMTIYVRSSDNRVSMNDWTAVSEDPSIFVVSNISHDPQHHSFSFAGQAVSAGTATVVIADGNGAVQARHPIVVALPDRVELLAHGLLLIGRSEAEASEPDLHIRSGGTATYLARYYQGPTQLYGNGALGATSQSSVTPHVLHTFLFEDRDWLQLSTAQTGNFMVALSTGGTHVADAPLVAVPDSAVRTVNILGEDESKARQDDWLVALAQANDDPAGRGRNIYGVAYQWEIDGQPQGGFDFNLGDPSVGDLYRYKYDPKQPRMLTATFNGVSNSAMIHWGGGFVDSSNHVGCSAAPGRPAESAAWLAGFVALWGFAFAARRRRRH